MAHEIGSLRLLPNGESLFIGSSSGVFFINTVRRAFSRAVAAVSRERSSSINEDTVSSLSSLPSPEECIFGPNPHRDTAPPDASNIGELPNHVVAKELLITYFRTWHPLLPFLHGPTCLEELESVYAAETAGQPRKPRSRSTAVILQCLFNIAKLERPDLPQLGQSRIRSEEQLLLALSSLALKCDLSSVQALLAAQLYFVATMCLQAASTTGGLVLRSIYKSGLHRCPVRYSNLSANDRDMRKRLFWSAYCLDRFMSQCLGHPLGIQDSDIDVCPPGQTELHEPVFPINRAEEGTSPEEAILHLPANHPQRLYASAQSSVDSPQHRTYEAPLHEPEEEQPFEAPPPRTVVEDSATQQRSQNQSVQAQFVRYSRFVGRMIEMFHKSIHIRSASRNNILFLKADIDAWANNMPFSSTTASSHSDSSMRPEAGSAGLNQDLFFEIARQQLLLLVNRPSLSLEPGSAEFRHAIQICIGAARSIIRMLDSHFNSRGNLFWPGFMSSVWMSGLIMIFACQLKLHSISNAVTDILASLRILKAMTQRWGIAQNCHEVLSMLLESTQSPAVPRLCSGQNAERNGPRSLRLQDQLFPRGQKRAREDYPLSLSDGHDSTRVRLSRRPSQSLRPSSAAMGIEERAQPVSIPRVDSSQGRTLRYNAGCDHFEINDQATASTTSMNPYYFTALQQAEHMNSVPDLSINYQFMHPSQRATTPDTSVANNLCSNEWNTNSRFTPEGDPTPVYDVFDGAMWGSLLELLGSNG